MDTLAAWRLTHLVLADSFPPVERAREKVLHRFGPYSPVSYLVSCSFCLGVWSAAVVVAARRLFPDVWRPVAQGLAIAACVPFLEAAAERVT